MLGGTFFLATEILELVENLGAVNDLSGKARLFLVYPVAILDAAFVIWIFISLVKTIGKLQVSKTSSLYPLLVPLQYQYCYTLYPLCLHEFFSPQAPTYVI
jgi:hypothetical protein